MARFFSSSWNCLAVLGMLFFSACLPKQEEVELGEVDGYVLYDGRPLPRALVVFQPQTDNGSNSMGLTDDDGYFTLAYSRRHTGAVLGKHAVVINLWFPEEELPTTPYDDLPERYNTKTELTVDVQPGQNSFDFKLQSDPPAAPAEPAEAL